MFGFLRSSAFIDPELGELRRSGGRWRGKFQLSGNVIPLAISGSRTRPDAEAMALAKALPATWARNSDAVAQALVDHLAPYREAVAAGEVEPPSQPLPPVGRAAEVWATVKVLSASVTPLDGTLVSEVALAAAWDEEHTLGARFQEATFFELNGSILPE